MSVNETPIPSDEELEDLDRPELRGIAADHNVPAGADKTETDLRRQLRAMRDKGGIPLRCPRKGGCGREWVYTGDAQYRTSCPRCGTSVRIEANRIT